MPLTPKGEGIKAAMQKEYGGKKGESVFYASRNKGTIKGVESRESCDDKDARTIREAGRRLKRAMKPRGRG